MALAFAAVLFVSGCSSGSSSYESAEAGDYAYNYDSNAAEAEYEEEFSIGQDGVGNTAIPFNQSPDREIVYAVDMRLETLNLDSGMDDLLAEVERVGGYVQSSYIRGRSLYDTQKVGERYVNYTVRVPSKDLADFILTMRGWYNLVELTQTSQDITTSYNLTDTNVANKAEQLERLQRELEEAEDEAVRLEMEAQIKALQEEIALSQALQEQMEHDVTYSTVSIRLSEIDEDLIIYYTTPDTFGSRVGRTSGDSWGSFVGFCQGVVLFFIAAWPTLLILAVLAAIVLVIVRIARKRLEKKAKENPKQRRPMPPYPPPGYPQMGVGPPVYRDNVPQPQGQTPPPPPESGEPQPPDGAGPAAPPNDENQPK